MARGSRGEIVAKHDVSVEPELAFQPSLGAMLPRRGTRFIPAQRNLAAPKSERDDRDNGNSEHQIDPGPSRHPLILCGLSGKLRNVVSPRCCLTHCTATASCLTRIMGAISCL